MELNLHKYAESLREKKAEDAKKFEESDPDLCMLCGAYGADKRSLFISYFYDIKEVVPEALDLSGMEDAFKGFYLRTCKNCRASFLGMMEEWRNERVALRGVPKDHDGYLEEDDPDKNIPVRINGVIVMMNKDEWDEWREANES